MMQLGSRVLFAFKWNFLLRSVVCSDEIWTWIFWHFLLNPLFQEIATQELANLQEQKVTPKIRCCVSCHRCTGLTWAWDWLFGWAVNRLAQPLCQTRWTSQEVNFYIPNTYSLLSMYSLYCIINIFNKDIWRWIRFCGGEPAWRVSGPARRDEEPDRWGKLQMEAGPADGRLCLQAAQRGRDQVESPHHHWPRQAGREVTSSSKAFYMKYSLRYGVASIARNNLVASAQNIQGAQVDYRISIFSLKCDLYI